MGPPEGSDTPEPKENFAAPILVWHRAVGVTTVLILVGIGIVLLPKWQIERRHDERLRAIVSEVCSQLEGRPDIGTCDAGGVNMETHYTCLFDVVVTRDEDASSPLNIAMTPQLRSLTVGTVDTWFVDGEGEGMVAVRFQADSEGDPRCEL